MNQSGRLSQPMAAELYALAQRVAPPAVAYQQRQAGYPANTHAVDMLVKEALTVAQRREFTSRHVSAMRLSRVRILRERV